MITLKLGPVSTNCYLLINGRSHETIIIDPADDGERIRERCEKEKAVPVAVFLTHGHFDHIGAAGYLKDAYNIPVCVGEKEKEIINDPALNCSFMAGSAIRVIGDRFFKDGETFETAGFSIKVIQTSGHTIGGVCYYLKDENILFSGDTLFHNGYGRTDLPTGDADTLFASIREKLFALPGNTVVYPGHESETTLEAERKHF